MIRRFTPHVYQRAAIERIVRDRAVGLFLRPGLGKTVITLSAIARLKYKMLRIQRALVIAPKAVAQATWHAEAASWDATAMLRVVRVLGSAREREEALARRGDVWVINRENVPWLVKYYAGKPWPFSMIVVDESTSFKNPRSKRFRALQRVAQSAERVVILSGTPAGKGLEDLWAQVYLLDGGERLGRTLSAYRQAYFYADRVGPGGVVYSYKPRAHADREIWDKVRDICVSLKAEDYIALPALTKQIIPAPLPPSAAAAYRTLERDSILRLRDNMGSTHIAEIPALSAAALCGKLSQAANGAVYDDAGGAHEIHTAKLDALDALLDRLRGAPALILYQYKHDADRITARLNRRSGFRWMAHTARNDTESLIRLWNDGKLNAILAHPESAGYGLNLQHGGRHIIFYGLTWSYEQEDQTICRLYRQGQDAQDVTVHYIVAPETIDEDILAAVSRKRSTNEALIEALKARIEKGEK